MNKLIKAKLQMAILNGESINSKTLFLYAIAILLVHTTLGNFKYLEEVYKYLYISHL